MWGFGGRYYWGRKGRGKVEGIVVVFAWMSSEDKHLKNYVDLYSSLGWSSLVCHSQFLNLFFPDKAASLAREIAMSSKELKLRPCPIVFASFSGGPKSCMYKVLQDDDRLVRDCVSGHIFDSTPVDFGIGAPYLILCSEDDDLAPFQVIHNFANRLKDLGADVKLAKWNSSSHVGHFRHYPEEYRAVVTELLQKAAVIYSQRIRQLEGEKMGMEGAHDEISDPFSNLRKAAAKSSQSLQRIDLDSSDHFYMPTSLEYHEDRDVGSVQDERKEHYIPLPCPPKINAHGVLGQFLFDACVPKNVEDWDLRSSPSMRRRVPFGPGRRHSAFNPIKCIRRSRL
ncbi:UNVERIFIED_CONTAM: hypothetical protein Sradi_3765800 [Sesamum radiatum]|uniref:DUF829 domain-containing protein n=1 Tax=Sesamum radiatum TaxID=300843 RepID=A0AAW2PZ68_SESRA